MADNSIMFRGLPRDPDSQWSRERMGRYSAPWDTVRNAIASYNSGASQIKPEYKDYEKYADKSYNEEEQQFFREMLKYMLENRLRGDGKSPVPKDSVEAADQIIGKDLYR